MVNHIRKIKMRIIILMSYCLIVTFSVSCQSPIASREEKSNRNDSTRTQTKNEQSYENLPIYEEQLTAIGGKIGYLEEKNLKNALQAVGFVRVHNQDKASVTSLYGGKVQAIFITPGTMVKKGQLLATLANPQIISLQEEYLTLVNNLELTKIELLRQEELMQGNAGALKNLQNVKSKYALLGIRKASVQKQLALAGINPVQLSPDNIRETIGVTAPITGTVSNITIEIGGNADAGAVIANIINNAEVDLDLYVYEKDIDKIKIGQEIMFNLSNNPDKGGKAIVDKIGSSFEGENKSIAIHAQIAK
ncbi:MAG TPA: efflux RND transporter periplasmic adaptor subunit, partial [Pseudosphingobacterium sp.]|nr:efflux RND transporter periplasmic adaptor subunit [Pseudosphingobacterium sp.]